MPFVYTLNVDIVTDAASRSFLVLPGVCLHLELYHCDRRCIAWFPCVSMPFGYTFYFDLYLATHVTDAASRGFLVYNMYLATPCDRQCIAWFPGVSMSFCYTLYFDLYLATHVTDAASRGFLVLACIWLHLLLSPVFGYTL